MSRVGSGLLALLFLLGCTIAYPTLTRPVTIELENYHPAGVKHLEQCGVDRTGCVRILGSKLIQTAGRSRVTFRPRSSSTVLRVVFLAGGSWYLPPERLLAGEVWQLRIESRRSMSTLSRRMAP